MTRRLAVLLALVLGLTACASTVPFQTTAAHSEAPAAVWVFGDSIPAGTWLAEGESWPSRLDEALGAGTQVRNFAVGGQAVAYARPGEVRMDQLVRDTLTATPRAEWPTAILFSGGTNDLIQSANDMYATRAAIFNLSNWVGANAPGVAFYVMTIPPLRSDSGYADALSLRRANLNDWERAQWNPYGQLIDVGDVLTAGPTYADPRFYRDPLHPDADGAQATADAVLTLLEQKGAV